MEVKKLVCDVCGGQIEMQSGGKGICTSCGTPYSAEIIKDKIQEIRGTVKIDGPVETVNGDAEKERLMKTAQECFRKGAVDEANKMFRKISKDYPNEWRAWMGILYSESLSLTNDQIRSKFISQYSTDKEEPEQYLESEYRKALAFAPDDEQHKIKEYREYSLKTLLLNIEQIKLNDKIEDLEREKNDKINLLAYYKETWNSSKQIISTKNKRSIFGIVILAIAIISFFITIKQSWIGVLISVVLGISGFVFASFTQPENKEIKEEKSLRDGIGKTTEEIKKLEDEIIELKTKLEKIS